MKNVFLVFTLLALVSACSSSQTATKKLSLSGTTWDYTDDDGDHYQITFHPQGRLSSTNPNDNTPDNDRWSQDQTSVKFSFNDGYSKYIGTVKTIDLIEGTASSVAGEWIWELKRVQYSD